MNFKVTKTVRLIDEEQLEQYIRENFDTAEAAYYISRKHFYEFFDWLNGRVPEMQDFKNFLRDAGYLFEFLDIEIVE